MTKEQKKKYNKKYYLKNKDKICSKVKEHLEKQFTEGMSWDNHGEWHIDHIKPISSFDKDTPPSIVNAFENLQPLWGVDNLKKHNNL